MSWRENGLLSFYSFRSAPICSQYFLLAARCTGMPKRSDLAWAGVDTRLSDAARVGMGLVCRGECAALYRLSKSSRQLFVDKPS